MIIGHLARTIHRRSVVAGCNAKGGYAASTASRAASSVQYRTVGI